MSKEMDRSWPVLRMICAGALLAGGVAAPLVITAAVPAHAQASAKAVVDAAKARGEVGEQTDGFIGVRSGAGPAVRAAVAEINSGRRRVYAAAAAKTGATSEAAAGAAAAQLIAGIPPGQYYKDASGAWVRK